MSEKISLDSSESIEYETTHRGIHVRAFPADFLHD